MELCNQQTPQKSFFSVKNDLKGRYKVRFTKTCGSFHSPFTLLLILKLFLSSLIPVYLILNSLVLPFLTNLFHAEFRTRFSRLYKDLVIITKEKYVKSIMEQFLDNPMQETGEIREMLKHYTPKLPLDA